MLVQPAIEYRQQRLRIMQGFTQHSACRGVYFLVQLLRDGLAAIEKNQQGLERCKYAIAICLDIGLLAYLFGFALCFLQYFFCSTTRLREQGLVPAHLVQLRRFDQDVFFYLERRGFLVIF